MTLLQPLYRGIPTVEDILLVVEVADTSADLERQVRVPTFAKAGIREVWLVNPDRDVLEAYRDPNQEGTGASASLVVVTR